MTTPADVLKIIIGVMLLVIAIGVYVGEPTQQRIEKCVEVTNYTEERCRWEVTR